MTLAFLMDQHIHAAVTNGLRRRGIDVLTAFEDGRADASDEELLARAAELRRILVTQDQDFLRIAAEFQKTGQDFAGIAFGFQGQLDVRSIIEYLELFAKATTFDEMRGRVEFIRSLE